MGNLKKYGNIMFDLETLDSKNTAVILSIAAVEFNKDTGDIGGKLHLRVDIQSCLDEGLTVGADTFIWWLQQSEEARKKIYSVKGIPLEDALTQVFKFVKDCGNNVVVWGNGSTFDISILENAMYKFFSELPWKFWNVNDVRTIVALNPDIKKNLNFEGIAHDALFDCIHQIKYLTDTLKSIKNGN